MIPLFICLYKFTCTKSGIYIYIYKSKVKLASLVEGDPKVPFSIATTPRSTVGRYSILWILLYP